MSAIRVRAHEIIDYISDNKIAEAVNFLEYLKLKEEVEATGEILSDKKMLDAIKKGLKQVSEGDLVELDSVIEDV